MVANTNYWSASYDKLSGSIATIIHPGPTVSSSTASAPVVPSLPQLDQADYKNIKFWHQNDYKAAHSKKKGRNSIVDPSDKPGRPRRGSGRLAETGENVQTDFIEDIEGNPVSGIMASAVRSLVCRLLSQMERDGMVTPDSWGEASMVERGYMLQELYKEYPCVAWCHNHWKADVLVSRVLSGRKSNAKKREKTAKIEPRTESLSPMIDRNPEGSSTDRKRKSAPLPGTTPPEPKRLRGELYTISPCPSPSPSRSPSARPKVGTLEVICAYMLYTC